jgi:hypothetical protein
MPAQVVNKRILHSYTNECKITTLKVLHLNTEKIGSNH